MQRTWLSLLATPGLGSRSGQKLLQACGTPAAVLGADRSQLRDLGCDDATIAALKQPDGRLLDAWEAWLAAPNRQLISCTDARYPRRLLDLDDYPLALFCDGDVDLLQTMQLAIVGSRNPTPAGRQRAKGLAAYLAQSGLVITSGLALGIDAAAHEGALTSTGLTIAVLANGLDQIYPARNRELAARIRAQGLLISEMGPGTAPRPGLFPRRNRIISGLSLGTLVVEAALRSGSLITARLAAEQGREVFAIPGSVDNPTARGCHNLIKNGAKLVEDAGDILEELAPMIDNGHEFPLPHEPMTVAETPVDEEYQRLLAHLDNAPISIDTLVDRTGLAVETVSSMLLILELHGAVATAPGGGYQRLTAGSSR